jgi:hypothetical protein
MAGSGTSTTAEDRALNGSGQANIVPMLLLIVAACGGDRTPEPDLVWSEQRSELYDPVAGTWSGTGSLATPRDGHTATLLPSGRVLVTGGITVVAGPNSKNVILATSELYDPATGTWSATGSLATARFLHTATLLPSGKVLVAGGIGQSGYLASAELIGVTPRRKAA